MWHVEFLGTQVGYGGAEAQIVVKDLSMPSLPYTVRIVRFRSLTYEKPRFAVRAQALFPSRGMAYLLIKDLPRVVKRELRRLYPVAVMALSMEELL